MIRRAVGLAGALAGAAVMVGGLASPAAATPAGAVYQACSSSPLPIGHVVSRQYNNPFLCDFLGPVGPANLYNMSDRFVLPTGLDAVGKVYDVCMSTLPATWTAVSTFNSVNCGYFNPGGNTVRIRFSGKVG